MTFVRCHDLVVVVNGFSSLRFFSALQCCVASFVRRGHVVESVRWRCIRFLLPLRVFQRFVSGLRFLFSVASLGCLRFLTILCHTINMLAIFAIQSTCLRSVSFENVSHNFNMFAIFDNNFNMFAILSTINMVRSLMLKHHAILSTITRDLCHTITAILPTNR